MSLRWHQWIRDSNFTLGRVPCQYTHTHAKIDFEYLLHGSTIINPMDDDAAEEFSNFMRKPRKKF